MSDTPPLLATPDDLATKLGVGATDARLLVALRAASARFRGAVRWQVHQSENAVLLVNGSGAIDLRLPVRDVSAIASVKVDGETVAVDWDEHGLLNRQDGRRWCARRRGVEVTLTYGHDPIPDTIQAAVAEHAEAAYNRLVGLTTKQVGGITLTFAQGVTTDWTDAVEAYKLDGRA